MKDTHQKVTPIRPGQSTGSNGSNGSHGERLARIEERLEHTATREDLQSAMNRMLFWFIGLLGGVIGILGGAVVALVVALFRLLAG